MDFSTMNGDTTILIILLISLIISMLLTVMLRNLIKSAIALSLVSAVLSIVMFLLNCPLAAVFELSVCAGLVTVLFISTISLTKHKSDEEIIEHKKSRKIRFHPLPVLIVILTLLLAALWPMIDNQWIFGKISSDLSVQDVLWHERQIDLIGQVIIVFAGVFGIVLLFKEREKK